VSSYIGEYLAFFDQCSRGSPTKPTKPITEGGNVGFVGCASEEYPEFRDPWPPRPVELATWPTEWRQRWGERANALEGLGVRFPESERQAWMEIRLELAAYEAEHGAVERNKRPVDADGVDDFKDVVWDGQSWAISIDEVRQWNAAVNGRRKSP
jgi:hypothetical protein